MTNERTTALRLAVSPERADILVAELADDGFTGFSEEGDRLVGYILSAEWAGDLKASVLARMASMGVVVEEETELEPQNWNARWEASIEPVTAGPFCVHPPWLSPEPGSVSIVIEPKMSFGTGHHETTRLMLTLVARFVRLGSTVLDVGTGTGVLAIASVRLGAECAEAFDVDPWSVANAVENARANDSSDRIAVRLGGIEVAPRGPFDLVLANINRNVLIDMLPGIVDRLTASGIVLLAGFLSSDRADMIGALTRAGLSVADELAEGDWLALAAARA